MNARRLTLAKPLHHLEGALGALGQGDGDLEPLRLADKVRTDLIYDPAHLLARPLQRGDLLERLAYLGPGELKPQGQSALPLQPPVYGHGEQLFEDVGVAGVHLPQGQVRQHLQRRLAALLEGNDDAELLLFPRGVGDQLPDDPLHLQLCPVLGSDLADGGDDLLGGELDPQGQPAHVRGELVDGLGQEIIVEEGVHVGTAQLLDVEVRAGEGGVDAKGDQGDEQDGNEQQGQESGNRAPDEDH